MLLTACRTQSHTLSTSATNHTAAHLHRDSIYLHDSIHVEYRRGILKHSYNPLIGPPKFYPTIEEKGISLDSFNSLIGNPVSCSSAERGCLYNSHNSYLRYAPNNQEYTPLIRSPDTVIVEKWHTRWRDRETVRTDTIQVETTKTETVQVRYVPEFYKYCAALTALLLLFLLIRFALWLYKRFHP